MTPQLACVILAGGRSSRFKSNKTKLLHELSGKPLVEWVLDTFVQLEPAEVVIVYGEQSAELTRRYAHGYKGLKISFALQDPPKGTADALAKVEPFIGEEIREILVVPGDAPLITAAMLKELPKIKKQLRCDHVALTAEIDNPFGYGRVVRDPETPEMIAMIVEEADASAEKRQLKEINSSMYLFSPDVFEHLRVAANLIGASAVKDEFYLTDVARVSQMGAYMIKDYSLIQGINDRLQLSQMDVFIQRRIREYWMREGVSFILPESTYLHTDIQLAPDVEVGPRCILSQGTRIGRGTRLIESCNLENCEIGEDCHLVHVRAQGATLHNGVIAGPFVNLRPGTVLHDGVRVGNFVETKNSEVGAGSKLPHLQYVGDASIGEGCNIGAGTIFCNYDGFAKHRTVIGDGVFIGSNSSLQAPLTIGDGAFVAMASAVTKDVPAGDLAVARARQENKAGYATELRARKEREASQASEPMLMEDLNVAALDSIAEAFSDAFEGAGLGADPGGAISGTYQRQHAEPESAIGSASADDVALGGSDDSESAGDADRIAHDGLTEHNEEAQP